MGTKEKRLDLDKSISIKEDLDELFDGLIFDDTVTNDASTKDLIDRFHQRREEKASYYSKEPAKTKYAEEIFAGLERKRPYLPRFYESETWLIDYEDGIHEISKADYLNLYMSTDVYLEFNRHYEKLFMVKREGAYLFLIGTKNGGLRVLDGGLAGKTLHVPLEYFYDNLPKYVESVNKYLLKYFSYQRRIAKFLEKIGGEPRLSEAYIGVRKLSLFLNPLDFSVDLNCFSEKKYDNLEKLLKGHRRDMYWKYLHVNGRALEEELQIKYNESKSINYNEYYEHSLRTDRISKAVKSLAYTFKYKIVRLWNDSVIPDGTEESGKKIVLGSIYSESEAK